MLKGIIGIDFGLKHIGIAFGQLISRTSKPLGSVSVRKGQISWDELDVYYNTWQPDAFVLGLSLNMDGTNQRFHSQLVHFKKCLELRYGLEVFWSDERLSTIEAKEILFKSLGKKGLRKTNIDSVSAQVILQRWLDGCENN